MALTLKRLFDALCSNLNDHYNRGESQRPLTPYSPSQASALDVRLCPRIHAIIPVRGFFRTFISSKTFTLQQ